MTAPTIQRVPIDVVLYALRRTGIHANPRTVRNWTHRGHITHTTDGYDLTEIHTYLTTRAQDHHTRD